MLFYTVWIVNKAGQLIYQRDLSTVPRLDGNECLRLASTFHSLHSIAGEVAPIASVGIEELEADTFTLRCFQSRTGLKMFILAERGTPDLASVLATLYEYYADFVLKNPFYDLDMPIRCEKFDSAVDKLVADLGRRKADRSDY
eukprot:PLAT8291.1.p2 GENE.PLAT8291.1~~PLAT8291.1.p2  ORF type:complete len:143 (-),score=61.39 PLAT8291.1:69-497(-)